MALIVFWLIFEHPDTDPESQMSWVIWKALTALFILDITLLTPVINTD